MLFLLLATAPFILLSFRYFSTQKVHNIRYYKSLLYVSKTCSMLIWPFLYINQKHATIARRLMQ